MWHTGLLFPRQQLTHRPPLASFTGLYVWTQWILWFIVSKFLICFNYFAGKIEAEGSGLIFLFISFFPLCPAPVEVCISSRQPISHTFPSQSLIYKHVIIFLTLKIKLFINPAFPSNATSSLIYLFQDVSTYMASVTIHLLLSSLPVLDSHFLNLVAFSIFMLFTSQHHFTF